MTSSDAAVAAPTAAAPRDSSRTRRRFRGGQAALWLFAAPAIAVYTYFLAVPTLQTVLYSITDWDGYSADFAWVGAGNYADIATNDSQFRGALFNSLQFTLVVAGDRAKVASTLDGIGYEWVELDARGRPR